MLGFLLWATPGGADTPCGSVSVIPQAQAGLRSECEVIWAFYTGLDDAGTLDDPANPSAWLPTTPFTEWQGVAVRGNAVEALILPSSGLEGVLTPELGRLADLLTLDLGGNRLRGPIPPELGGLTGLQSLFLHNNRFTGRVPRELAMMSRLEVLELSGNDLEGPIPLELGRLVHLEGLFLHGNRLSGPIPKELGDLAMLERLSLRGNRLTGAIPPELGQLSRLVSLDLSLNDLTGPVPAALGRLDKLEILRLQGNRLHTSGSDGPFTPGPLVPEPSPGPERPLSPPSGRFSDDDGSTHEANIETIAALGVTIGCNPPHNDRFCPGESVTRAQMVVLLSRVLGGTGQVDPPGVRAGDVPEDAWYLDELRHMIARGVVDLSGDGAFRPLDPLTRMEMAVLLVRAFPALVEVRVPEGVFVDVPAARVEAGAVEGVLQAGVTTGCSADPLAYCPDQPVSRDQMASFLVRALRVQPIDAGVAARPGSGVKVRMARPVWPSGYFQAALYRALLLELGYEVGDPTELELEPMDAYLGMAEGRVDFWSAGWYPEHDAFLDLQVGDGILVRDRVSPIGAQMEAGGLHGFLISGDFAGRHGIATLDDLDRNPAALAEFDAADAITGNGIADIYGCPSSWACYDIIDSMIAFSGWENIDQVTGPHEAMHAEAVAKLRRGAPILIYAWTPGKHLGTIAPGVDVVWLGVEQVLDDSNPRRRPDGARFDQRPGSAPIGPSMCPAAADKGTCPLGWRASDILVTASDEFVEANPAAARLFELVRLDPFDVSRRIAMQSRGADVDDLASRWIAQHRDLVDIWLNQARIAGREVSAA